MSVDQHAGWVPIWCTHANFKNLDFGGLFLNDLMWVQEFGTGPASWSGADLGLIMLTYYMIIVSKGVIKSAFWARKSNVYNKSFLSIQKNGTGPASWSGADYIFRFWSSGKIRKNVFAINLVVY